MTLAASSGRSRGCRALVVWDGWTRVWVANERRRTLESSCTPSPFSSAHGAPEHVDRLGGATTSCMKLAYRLTRHWILTGTLKGLMLDVMRGMSVIRCAFETLGRRSASGLRPLLLAQKWKVRSNNDIRFGRRQDGHFV